MSLKTLALLILLGTVGTGFACTPPKEMSGNPAGAGFIALQIENARSPEGFSALSISALPSPRLEVVKFKVTVTGEGIEPPILVEADRAATEIEVLGIPPGPARSILIEALNSEGEVIRRRRIDNVTISPGVVTPIQTSLNTVPLILNLRNGGIVITRNLKIVGFGEPGSTLEVTSETKDGTLSLAISPDGDPIVVSPSLSTGLFELIPGERPLGRQTITVTDNGSKESSSVTVSVITGDDRPGRRISPAGALGPSISVGPGIGGPRSTHFPAILNNMGGHQ